MVLYCNDSTIRQQILKAIGNDDSVLWQDLKDKEEKQVDNQQIDRLLDFYQQEYDNHKEDICEFIVIQ